METERLEIGRQELPVSMSEVINKYELRRKKLQL